MQGTGIVDVDGHGGDFEYVVFKSHEGMIGPDAKAPVLGKAVAADAGTGKNHVGVGGPHLDGLHDLDEVHPVFLGKPAPFVQEGQNGGPVGIFHDLAGFAFNGTIQDGQGKLINIQDIG